MTLVLLFILDGRAFSLGAHRDLTERTLELEGQALPEVERYGRLAVRASVEEDLDVFTKWLVFNHYFQPTDVKRTRRRSSNERIGHLWSQVQDAQRTRDWRRFYDRLGRVLHHLQDMGSPAHVVPIQHGLGDRFERVDVEMLVSRVDGMRVGEHDIAPLDAPTAHAQLAWDTWSTVQSGTLEACGESLPWTAYWAARPEHFGRYGERGNRFGVVGHDATCATLELGFESFVTERVDDVLHFSRAVLRFLEDDGSRPVAMP